MISNVGSAKASPCLAALYAKQSVQPQPRDRSPFALRLSRMRGPCSSLATKPPDGLMAGSSLLRSKFLSEGQSFDLRIFLFLQFSRVVCRLKWSCRCGNGFLLIIDRHLLLECNASTSLPRFLAEIQLELQLTVVIP